MGFCRRCGDIVTGTRCKCGGVAVAPVLQWSSSTCQAVDKWSQTYISKDRSPTCSPIQIDSTLSASQPSATLTGLRPEVVQCAPQSTVASGWFPRPSSSRPSTSTSSRLSSHTATSSSSVLHGQSDADECRPPSPATAAAEAGILQSPNAPELSKAYGSVLQPKESLSTYSCGLCRTEFQPDATIFPDPSTPESPDRFLCRPCFVINGGSKGDCPVCRRPVLILKSEGGFVEHSGLFWHKKCFTCEKCHKNIGDTPLVDLTGRPTCADCFGTFLNEYSTPRKPRALSNLEKTDSRPSSTLFADSKSREGSPTIDELEQRLGIMKCREGSPVLEELAQRLNAVLNRTPRDSSPLMSSSIPNLNKEDEESSSLNRRTLQRKKSVTFTTTRHDADPNDILAGADTFEERKTTIPRQAPRVDSLHQIHGSPSTRPSFDAIEEMKSRFTSQAASPPASLADLTSHGSPPNATTNSPGSTPSRIPRISRISGSPGLRHAVSTSSLRSSRVSWSPSTPDLIPDMSDTLTQSSGPSSPPSFSPHAHSLEDLGNHPREHTPNKKAATECSTSGRVTPKLRDTLNKSSIPTATLSSGSLCAKCGGSLFVTGGSCRFVTVPELSTSGPPKTYHTECFRCALCDGPFRETSNGQALFVRGEGGACHIECAPVAKTKSTTTRLIKSTSLDPTLSPPLAPLTNTMESVPRLSTRTRQTQSSKVSSHHNNNSYSSSRFETVPPAVPSMSLPFSRFGSSTICPGCQKSVSPMEMGVVPGPQGSRWHATCLICGGKSTGKGRRDKSQPGCGKRLDSAAKRDVQGGVWCRECLLLLPLDMRTAQVELSHQPIVPSHTGRSTGGGPFVAAQLTGTTTIARQFTGRGGGDSAILRQLTGGGLSPTRQLTASPTKQLGTPRARPKSVLGIRSSKSIDEGRGMYLVRQMTGGGGTKYVDGL